MPPADKTAGHNFGTTLKYVKGWRKMDKVCCFCSQFVFSPVSHVCGYSCAGKHLAASESERSLGRRS